MRRDATASSPIIASRNDHVDTALCGPGRNKLDRYASDLTDASYACIRSGLQLSAGRTARRFACYARNGLRGPRWKSTSCRGSLMSSTLSTCSVGSGFPAAWVAP